MISVKFKQASELRNLFSSIAELVREMQIVFDEEGMKTAVFCNGGFCAFFFKLGKENFIDYAVTKRIELIVMADDLYDVFKTVKKDDILELREDSSKIYCSVVGKKKNEFEIPLLGVADLRIPPKSDLSSSCKVFIMLPCVEFREALSSSLTFAKGKSKTISFVNKNKKVFIERVADVTKVSKIELCDTEISEIIKSNFNVEFINKFMLASSSFEFVTLKFAHSHPLQIELLANNNFKIWFFLAPIVDND